MSLEVTTQAAEPNTPVTPPVDDPKPTENVSGLKSALEKERLRAKTAENLFSQFTKDLGTADAASIKAALQFKADAETKQLEEAQAWNELKERQAAAHKTELTKAQKTADERILKYETQLRSVMVDSVLKSEAVRQGIHEDALDNFVSLAKKNIDLTVDGDSISVAVKNNLGADISEMVTNLKNQPSFGIFFKPDVATGSGAPNQRTGSQPVEIKKKSEMTYSEKSEWIDKYGAAARKVATVPSLSELAV